MGDQRRRLPPWGRSRVEPALTVAIAWPVYAIAGAVLVVDRGAMPLDSLGSIAAALSFWHESPYTPVAVADSGAPAGTLLLVPFGSARELSSSGYLLPVLSGALGAATLAVIGRVLADAEMRIGIRTGIVAAVGLNPLFAFYAMNGAGDVVHLLAASIALLLLLRAASRDDDSLLPALGTALAVGALARYELVVWAVVIAALLAGGAGGVGCRSNRIRAVWARPALAVSAWLLVAVLLGAGIEEAVGFTDPDPEGFDAAAAARDLLRAQLAFPLAPLILVALVLGRNSRVALQPLMIALLIATSLAATWGFAALDGATATIELRDVLPLIPLALAGAAWLHRSAPRATRRLVSASALVLTVIAIPSAWAQMRSFDNQDAELAFTRAISDSSDQSDAPRSSGPGPGLGSARQIVTLLESEQVSAGEVLADEATAVPLTALSGRPEVYLTPVEGGQSWERALADPVGRVRFVVVRLDGPDRVRSRYAPVETEGNRDLAPVLANEHYVALRVRGPG